MEKGFLRWIIVVFVASSLVFTSGIEAKGQQEDSSKVFIWLNAYTTNNWSNGQMPMPSKSWSNTQLTDYQHQGGAYYNGSASISNDGSRIAFVRGDTFFSDIYRIYSNGTGGQQVVNGQSPTYCYSPSISGDGLKIFYEKDYAMVAEDVFAPMIFWVSWDGTQGDGISQPIPTDWRGNVHPSPDDSGNSVVYQSWDGSDWQIYLTVGSSCKQITNNGVDHLYPSISGDGTKIVWAEQDSSDWDIYGAESPNWSPVCLSENGGNNGIVDTSPSISGDGTKVVWQGKSTTGDWDIWGVTWEANVGNRERKAGNGTNGDDKYPRINHGGWQIVYQSNEGSSSPNIWDVWTVSWYGKRARLTGPDTFTHEYPTKRGGCTIAYGRAASDLYYDLWALTEEIPNPDLFIYCQWDPAYANIEISPPPGAPPGATYRLAITSTVEGKLLGGVEVIVVNTTAPELRWAGTSGYTRDGVDPDRGIVGTNFVYKVKYVDADNNPPKEGGPLLYILKGNKPIQGSPFLMREGDKTDKNYTDGKIYSYSVRLSSPGNDYTYFFWTRDSLGVQATGPAANMILRVPWVITTRWGWLPSF